MVPIVQLSMWQGYMCSTSQGFKGPSVSRFQVACSCQCQSVCSGLSVSQSVSSVSQSSQSVSQSVSQPASQPAKPASQAKPVTYDIYISVQNVTTSVTHDRDLTKSDFQSSDTGQIKILPSSESSSIIHWIHHLRKPEPSLKDRRHCQTSEHTGQTPQAKQSDPPAPV